MTNADHYHSDLALWWPVFLIAVAVLWCGWRVLYLRWQIGARVLSFLSRPRTNPEKGLAITALVLDAYLITRAFMPALDDALYAAHILPPVIGLTVMTGGIFLMMLAQGQMGPAWRIGVPTAREYTQELVTAGVFRISRNPVYLGIMLFILGVLLLVPGPITAVSFIVSGALINTLIQSEEEFMQATFGAEYAAYCKKVRRWI